MIAVTGGAGFIGSRLVRALNRRGLADIVVVEDNLAEARARDTLVDLEMRALVDRHAFLAELEAGAQVDIVFHQGACTDTTVMDSHVMMEMNYDYSLSLFDLCQRRGIRFIYASSAAVYGDGSRGFGEEVVPPPPLNPYAHSKLRFDDEVRLRLGRIGAQVVGLRYFNVYGPGEGHKAHMASVVHQFYRQLATSGALRLFAGSDAILRDFVWIDDVVAVLLYLFDHPEISGIFNVGSGSAESFETVADLVRSAFETGRIEVVSFPEKLRGHYQFYTCADLTALRACGFIPPSTSLAIGVSRYLDVLGRVSGPSRSSPPSPAGEPRPDA